MATFLQDLDKTARQNNSWLCVGLDPDDTVDDVFDFNQGIISATLGLVCCFKVNTAFYEARGPPGIEALIKTIEYIKQFVRVPVIVDAKRADVAHSSKAYAKYLYELIGADAVTVSPYMGFDAIEPFLERRSKGVFILCRTSNPGAEDVQNISCPEPLYQIVARKALERNTRGNVGLVAGATRSSELKSVRGIVGDDVPLLIPGVGSQGGDLKEAVLSGANSQGNRGIITVSRDVIFAPSVHKAAAALRNEINEYRKSRISRVA
ncbi:MAG: orotidine-5'-phosphate decarboxylase [Halobacteriota archaeon]